jgi:hypothetical protein
MCEYHFWYIFMQLESHVQVESLTYPAFGTNYHSLLAVLRHV